MICILLLSVTFVMYFVGRNKDNYYYYLFYHSLCWCSFCASAVRKPCTWSISHSSKSFCLNTKHFSEDSRRSQHAELLNLSDTFLMFSTIPIQCFIIIIIIVIMRELLSEYVQQHRRTEMNTICQNQRHQLHEAHVKQ